MIDVIAAYSPLVEIGAGTGYWAWLLRGAGAHVIAYDKCPPRNADQENRFHPDSPTWTEVLQGDESVLDSIENRTLFLCWPPSGDRMAFQALSSFKGDSFIFVGEDHNVTTGEKEFFRLLDTEWHCDFSGGLPRWPRRDDAIFIYRRKGTVARRPSLRSSSASEYFDDPREWIEREWEEWQRAVKTEFTRHTVGIRNYEFLAFLCTQCGSECSFAKFDQEIRGNVYGTRTLGNCSCGNGWYREFCSRCSEPLDSRDSELNACPRCQSLVCLECEECRCKARDRAAQEEPKASPEPIPF